MKRTLFSARGGGGGSSSASNEPLLITMPEYLPEPRSNATAAATSAAVAKIGAYGDDEDLLPDPSTAKVAMKPLKEGAKCKSMLIVLGALGFLVSMATIGVLTWRFYGVQDDLSKLSVRLRAAETLLANHTGRLTSLNSTLLATTARSILNSLHIQQVNDTVTIHEERLVSLENRTTHLEIRLTDAEIKLIATMNDVTILQAQMLQAQQDIITINAEIVLLQQNASDHETRINALEASNTQNILNIQNLMLWLQSNLTAIDARLGALNTTYVVTASGTCELESGPAIVVPLTWETRRVHATGGYDVEYLWISDSAWTPIQVFLGPSNATYSFRIANFAASTPVFALPAISTPLARPLSAYQRQKFGVIPSTAFIGQVLSSKWNNEQVALEFSASVILFDGVIILEPLTFVIGFL